MAGTVVLSLFNSIVFSNFPVPSCWLSFLSYTDFLAYLTKASYFRVIFIDESVLISSQCAITNAAL